MSSRFSDADKAKILKMYLVDGMLFREIGDYFGTSDAEVSLVIRDTGVSGASNATGGGYGRRGRNSSKYAGGVYTRNKDGKQIILDEALFRKYFRERDPLEPLDVWLEHGSTKVSPKKAGAVAAGVVGAVMLGDAIGVGNFVNIGRVDIFDTPSANTSFKDDFIDEAKGIASGKLEDAAKDTIFNAVKAQFSNSGSSDATKKTPGLFDYNNNHYMGRISGKKPYKVCFEIGGLDGSRAIGNYSGGELDGYGLKYTSTAAKVGEFKKGTLNGVGVSRSGYTTYVGKMKNGKPTGYAVRIYNDEKVIVKVSKNGIKEIGYISGSTWYKSGKKTKEWKVKNNTYKGIKIDGNSIYIDDTKIDVYGDSIVYYNDDIAMSLDSRQASYDETENNEKGTKIDYYGSTVIGEYHDVNLKVSGQIVSE